MPDTMRKPLSFFKDVPQIRQDLGNDDDLRNLGESLQARQISPVGAKADGEPIWGFRRIMAARMVGLPDLVVTIYSEPLTETEIKIIQISENLHRLEMNPHDKWRAYEQLRHLNPKWTAKELGAHLKLDPAAITRWLSPSKCILAWQDAFKTGQVGITDCYVASPLSPEQQLELLKIKLTGASRDGIKIAADRMRTQPEDKETRMSRVTIPLPRGTKVVITGPNMSLEDASDTLNQCSKVVRDALKEGLDAKSFQTVMRGRSQAMQGDGHL